MKELNIDSFFGKSKEIIIEEEYSESNTKKVNIFDYLSDICFFKKGNIPEERDFEMKGWNTFMILKYLSLEDNYVSIINIFNPYQSILTPKQMYKMLLMIIPKRKKYLKYPKLQEQIYKDEDIKILQEYFNCSKQDIIEYLNFGFLSEFEINKIKKLFGGKESDGKKK